MRVGRRLHGRSLDQRQLEAEKAALARRALDFDLAAHLPDEPLWLIARPNPVLCVASESSPV